MKAATVYDFVARMRTRDDILDDAQHFPNVHGYIVESDQGSYYQIVSVDAEADRSFGYPVSTRTNLIVFFEQSGHAVKNDCVRCQITPARDIGDLRGTLAFDGRSFGGRINIAVTTMRRVS
jgi:hypothetical protein